MSDEQRLPSEGSGDAGALAFLATEYRTIEARIEALVGEWAMLESEALALPDGTGRLDFRSAMKSIDAQLDALADARTRCVDKVVTTPAQTLADVASKLTIAARELDGEGGPVHAIVAEAAAIVQGHASRHLLGP